jgi:hypothetical protein
VRSECRATPRSTGQKIGSPTALETCRGKRLPRVADAAAASLARSNRVPLCPFAASEWQPALRPPALPQPARPGAHSPCGHPAARTAWARARSGAGAGLGPRAARRGKSATSAHSRTEARPQASGGHARGRWTGSWRARASTRAGPPPGSGTAPPAPTTARARRSRRRRRPPRPRRVRVGAPPRARARARAETRRDCHQYSLPRTPSRARPRPTAWLRGAHRASPAGARETSERASERERALARGRRTQGASTSAARGLGRVAAAYSRARTDPMEGRWMWAAKARTWATTTCHPLRVPAGGARTARGA